MTATNKQIAKDLIASIDLSKFTARAVNEGALSRWNTDQAKSEYRQHLLLLWINITMSNKEFIVPTELAEVIWREHLDDESNYLRFCENLVGRYIPHDHGLEKGSPAFNKAVAHTKTVHDQYGSDGFYDSYVYVGS